MANGGMLEALGQGLQGAGAVLSSEVYQTQAEDRRAALINIARSLEIVKAKRELEADQQFAQFTKGLQPSAMTSEALFDVAKKVPIDVLSRSPQAQAFMQMTSQVQAREAAADARKEAINARYLQIEMMRDAQADRAANTKLSIEERADAKKRHDELTLQIARMHDAATRMGLVLRRDTLGLREDQRLEKINAPVEDLIKDVDQAIQMIQQNPGVTGARGVISRAVELGTSTFTGDTSTPANDFQSHLLQIQSKWRKLPTVAANRFKADAGKIDQQIKGLGLMTNDAIAINGLTQLRATLARGLEARGGKVPDDPQADEKQGPKVGDKQKSKSGRDMHFDGKQWVYD